jgi:outer membrane protein
MNYNMKLIAGLSLLLGAASAHAVEHPFEIRLGEYFVMYDAKASDLRQDGNGQPFQLPGGLNLDVKNVNTPYLAATYTFTPNWVLQLSAGIPPKTETIGKGPAALGSIPYNGQVVSTAKWFAPTLIVNYVIGPEAWPVRPYVGVGINYTHFYDRQSTAAGDAANGGPTSISLTNSTGFEWTVGAKVKLADRWHAYASYSATKVNSDYVGNTAGVIRRTSIKFNPSAFVLSVGYSF